VKYPLASREVTDGMCIEGKKHMENMQKTFDVVALSELVDFDEIIRTTYKDVKNTCIMLRRVENGKEASFVSVGSKGTYAKTINGCRMYVKTNVDSGKIECIKVSFDLVPGFNVVYDSTLKCSTAYNKKVALLKCYGSHMQRINDEFFANKQTAFQLGELRDDVRSFKFDKGLIDSVDLAHLALRIHSLARPCYEYLRSEKVRFERFVELFEEVPKKSNEKKSVNVGLEHGDTVVRTKKYAVGKCINEW
jgi:hypothetical protein